MALARHLPLVGLLLGGGVAAAAPPEAMCLARYYGVEPLTDGVRLADGSTIAYDTGRKTEEERLERPDIKDVFTPPYPTGASAAIAPVRDEHQDPGRARLDALFRQAYPARALVKATFFGRPVRVQPKVAEALGRVEKRLTGDAVVNPFVTALGGTYNPRNIAGTDRPSAHTYGIAIDLNPSLSHYWRWEKGGWQNRVPASVVHAFEAEGFIWGGRWFHFDTMHFEYRPELLDPGCYPRGTP
jgi:hypothetical protein